MANLDNVSPRIRFTFSFIENATPLIATTFYVESADDGYDEAYSAIASFFVH